MGHPAGVGQDQRLDVVGKQKSLQRWLRLASVSAKTPTSRKRREKWGTRRISVLGASYPPLQKAQGRGTRRMAAQARPVGPTFRVSRMPSRHHLAGRSKL
jgi:hypothetical protein